MLETEVKTSFQTLTLAQVFLFIYQQRSAQTPCTSHLLKAARNPNFTEAVLRKETYNGKCYPWQSTQKCPFLKHS